METGNALENGRRLPEEKEKRKERKER